MYREESATEEPKVKMRRRKARILSFDGAFVITIALKSSGRALFSLPLIFFVPFLQFCQEATSDSLIANSVCISLQHCILLIKLRFA